MWVFFFLLAVAARECLAVGSIIDLSWEFNNKTIFWPGQRPFSFTKITALDTDVGYWYAVNEFCTSEHGGTHFDAPYHFNKNGWKVSEVPVSRLYATGALVDLRNKTHNADIDLTVNDLQNWEERNGPFANGSVLIVKFGRSQYWNNKTKYFELDEYNQMNFPGVSKEAAQWIVDTGKFYGVGIDTTSVDPGRSVEYMAHRIFSANQFYHLENMKLLDELPGVSKEAAQWIVNTGKFYGVGLDTPSIDQGRSIEFRSHRIFSSNLIYHLENVKLLDELPERGFDLIVAPMKIEGGTGGPVRIFAIFNN